MVITETQAASAQREDVSALIDAAGEALASAAPSCVLLRNANGWLGLDGGRSLARWIEVADVTTFLVEADRETADALSLPAFAVGDVALTHPARGAQQALAAVKTLDADTRSVLAVICAAPTRLPRRWLSTCLDEDDVGARLLALMRLDLVEYRWFGTDLVVDTPDPTRRALDAIAAPDVLAVERRLLDAIARSAGAEVSDLGETATFERSRFLARHRALLRHAHDRLGDRRAAVVLPMLAGIEPPGTLATLLDERARCIAPEVPAMTRAALELRRAAFSARAVGEAKLSSYGPRRGTWSSCRAVSGCESAHLELLQYALSCALAGWTPGDTRALDLAAELQRSARRVERLDVEVRARGLMGCALLDAGDPKRALPELSFAIAKLAASGHHHFERWHSPTRSVAGAR